MSREYLSRVRYSWYIVDNLGSHKDHEVKLIKKAINEAKS